MTIITITEVLSATSVLEPSPGAAALTAGDTVDVGAERGSGSFGAVYECDAIAGLATPGIVIKRHNANGGITPEDNAAVLRALHAAIDTRWVGQAADARSLVPGVPYWVGQARWGADDVVISLARDLAAEGYVEFERVVSDLGLLRGWLGLDLEDRLAAAHSFASGHALVEELDYVHADLNVENVFVDSNGGRAAIIDWDSGVLPGSPNAGPLAWGKPDDFIAPEAKAGGTLDPSKIGVLSERWAVGWMVHYLLFGVAPLFFLAAVSDQTIRDYLRGNTWPDIDPGSPLINKPNWNFYTRYLQALADLPGPVVDRFRDLVTLGSQDPSARPSSAEWRDALQAVATAPEFDWVTLSARATVVGRTVRVSWSAPGATEVHVDGVGPLPATGWTEVALTTSRVVHLEAANAFGATVHDTRVIAVLVAPAVPDLVVPGSMLATPTAPGPAPLPSQPVPSLPSPGNVGLPAPAPMPSVRLARVATARLLTMPCFRRPVPPTWTPSGP